jgi:hypothetical protein
MDWAPSDSEGDKMLFLFDCGRLGSGANGIVIDGTEQGEWRRATVDDLDHFVIGRIARRIRPTVVANRSARLDYDQAK